MRLQRLLWELWPLRWLRTLQALLRGVRMHPSTVMLAPPGRYEFGRGCVIGAEVRIDTEHSGRVVAQERVWLASATELQTSTAIFIGAGTTIQRRASINGTVRIGRGCIFAPNVFISSGTHPFRHVPHLPIREQERMLVANPAARSLLDKPVWIQDDCWLGVNAVVCPGVTIGKGSVIGANAVVTRNVQPYSIVAGSPARVIGCRLEWRPHTCVDIQRPEDWIYVLSGTMFRSDGVRNSAIEVSQLEPLLVVVSAATTRATLHCWASMRMEVRAGGEQLLLESGTSSITCEVRPATGSVGEALVELTPCHEYRGAVLRVLKIDCS